MRFLSTHRRRRAAKPLMLAFALAAIGLVYAAVVPVPQAAAEGSTSTEVAAGKGLFQVSCSSCHGLNGEGTPAGPSLVGVGAAAVDFQVSTGRMPMAQPGQQAPQKVNTFTDSEITSLEAYVASLGPGPAVPSASAYAPGGLSAEQVAAGGELFRTNCSACHNFEGGGGALPNGKYAPSLKGVEDIHIYEAMRTGPQQMPVFSAGAIPDADAAAIIAYLDQLHAEPTAGFNLGGLGPVTEGLFGWIIGIGGLCLFAVWITSRGARAR